MARPPVTGAGSRADDGPGVGVGEAAGVGRAVSGGRGVAVAAGGVSVGGMDWQALSQRPSKMRTAKRFKGVYLT